MDTGAYCPFDSMVREPCGCIIGDALAGAIPLGRLSTVRDSLRRCAYTAILEAVMSRGKSGAEPAGLSQLNLNAAGIDVGATSHFVAVPADRAEQSVREFEAFTADLYRLADWLTECRVETVVMESTGVYWIPLFGVLEERGFQVMLVDPRRIKNVPGRKTDVLDCQWLQQLHTYGLLSGAFRPDEDIRRLRSYLRQRAMLVEYASHHVQHLQKALTQMNVKLRTSSETSPARPAWTSSRPSSGARGIPAGWPGCAIPGPRRTRRPSPSRCGDTGGRSTSLS